MLFQTVPFLTLFLIVIAGVAIIRRPRPQHILFLVASYVFYGWWDVRFLMLIVLSTVIDYVAALGMTGVKLSPGKRAGLSAVIAGSALLFLGPNWPLIQSGQSPIDWTEALSGSWSGRHAAIAIALVLAVMGPALYGLYFRLSERARRRAFLVTSIVANLGVLGFFKYFGFFAQSLMGFGSALGFDVNLPLIRIALPVGISFYTFQTMSYTIDAYRGDSPPERSFVRMALYVAYFPQLVAGPILRPSQFFPTLSTAWALNARNIVSGSNLIAVGLVKKVLIADHMSPFVQTVFGSPQGQPTLAVWLGAVMFAIQIYCDFSGYTDIARGLSRFFGIEIPLNFNFPYFSTSIIEFWRRWHISLSTWLRDYLYIPLGGNRLGSSRTYFNLMVTMVLGGLWHGAAWNFIVWGAYQGALLSVNRLFRGFCAHRPALSAWLDRPTGVVLRWAVTLYGWLLGWLIFRVGNPEDLIYCMKAFIVPDGRFALSSLGLGRGDPIIALLAAAAFIALHAWGFFTMRWDARLTRLPFPVLCIVYTLLGFGFFYLWPSSNAPFIYFQF